MNKLLSEDVDGCVRSLPTLVKTFVKKCDDLFIAGGFVRDVIGRQPVSDIDLFTTSKPRAAELAHQLQKEAEEAGHTLKSKVTENAVTLTGLRLPIQIISRWTFNSPADAIASFDFTISQACLFFNKTENTWDSVCSPRFYTDLAARRLIYTSPVRIEELGGSMLRVLKLYERGYRITLGSLSKVIARIASGVDTSRVSLSQEAQVAMIVHGLLREVDP